jgi:hypothetical protein
MKLKMPSAHTVMRRIISMPVEVSIGATPKGVSPYERRWNTPEANARRSMSDAKRIESIAGRLLEYRQQRGRWPNAAVRWSRKDRIWNRAMRLAKKRWDANPVLVVIEEEE